MDTTRFKKGIVDNHNIIDYCADVEMRIVDDTGDETLTVFGCLFYDQSINKYIVIELEVLNMLDEKKLITE